MDHISARFRRTRSVASPPGPAPAPAPSSTSTSTSTSSTSSRTASAHPEGKQPTSNPAVPPASTSQEAIPTLSITTPPRVGHSLIHSGSYLFHPPKSPFRALHLRSSNKRSRSPAPASLPLPASPAVVNHDGISELNMTSPDKDQGAGANMTPGELGGAIAADDQGEKVLEREHAKEQPRIPSFLNMSESDIAEKFAIVQWIDRDRQNAAASNTIPDFQFVSINPTFRRLDRYQNIQPWENNRVKLKVLEGACDYVNASPITLESPLNPTDRPPHWYIAMQGPKSVTADHVWRMVSEQSQKAVVIVMLTDIQENGLEKCYPYFPRAVDDVFGINEMDEFGDGFHARLKCVSVESRANGAILMRKLILHVGGQDESEDKEVWHLLYKRWPDFGVPALQDIDSFFELMRLSREKNDGIDNSRIVHCSAGVGRTGTFIALENLIRELDAGDLENYDENYGGEDAPDLVEQTVNSLREQRKFMVQAECQFLFIYQVLRKLWMRKYDIGDDSSDEPATKRLGVGHDPFIESKQAGL